MEWRRVVSPRRPSVARSPTPLAPDFFSAPVFAGVRRSHLGLHWDLGSKRWVPLASVSLLGWAVEELGVVCPLKRPQLRRLSKKLRGKAPPSLAVRGLERSVDDRVEPNAER